MRIFFHCPETIFQNLFIPQYTQLCIDSYWLSVSMGSKNPVPKGTNRKVMIGSRKAHTALNRCKVTSMRWTLTSMQTCGSEIQSCKLSGLFLEQFTNGTFVNAKSQLVWKSWWQTLHLPSRGIIHHVTITTRYDEGESFKNVLAFKWTDLNKSVEWECLSRWLLFVRGTNVFSWSYWSHP